MNITKTIALLAVAGAVVACDPFPAKPGGTPRVVHVGFNGGNLDDLTDPAPPTGLVFDDVAYNSSFYVWFNKPMDGSTIQKAPSTAANGAPVAIATACAVPGSPLEATSTLPAEALVCYAPGSAIDGGIIQVFHADDVAAVAGDGGWWKVGSYKVGGTVNDYQGNPITFDATFNVTLKPTLVRADAYTIDMAWPKQDGVVDYTIEEYVGTEATPTWSILRANQVWQRPTTALSGVNGGIRFWGLVPGEKHWYRITPNGVAGALPSSISTATLAAIPSLTMKANPLEGGVAAPLKASITWSRIRDDGANGVPSALYSVRRDDGAGFVEVASIARTSAAVVNYVDTVPAAGTYSYQVVPIFTDGLGGTREGTPTKTSTVTVAGPAAP